MIFAAFAAFAFHGGVSQSYRYQFVNEPGRDSRPASAKDAK